MVTAPPSLPTLRPLGPTARCPGRPVDLAGVIGIDGRLELAGADGFVVDWQLGTGPGVQQ